MRSMGGNLCDISRFWFVDISWHNSSLSVPHDVFLSTRILQSVLLTELLRDTPWFEPFICSVVSGIVKLRSAEMLISSLCAVWFFSVYLGTVNLGLYVCNCWISLVAWLLVYHKVTLFVFSMILVLRWLAPNVLTQLLSFSYLYLPFFACMCILCAYMCVYFCICTCTSVCGGQGLTLGAFLNLSSVFLP